jgi:hypothetical protein
MCGLTHEVQHTYTGTLCVSFPLVIALKHSS